MTKTVSATHRVCKICNAEKPLDIQHFYRQCPGFTPYCRTCDRSPAARSLEKRLSAGLCLGCDGFAREGRQLCAKCAEKNTALGQKRASRLREAGNCESCGQPRGKDAARCDKCVSRRRGARRRAYRRSLKDGLCTYCKCRPRRENSHWCEECRASHKAWRDKIKRAAIDGYGAVCACCGELQYEFLTIDHVNNDGGVERKATKYQIGIYQKIIAQNFPASYQILCYNCNCAKGVYGSCPHTWKKE